MMENGTPVIIEDSNDGEKLQQNKDLLTEGGLSDNSNTSSSSQTITDSVSLDSEDVKVPDSSSVIVIEDIEPREVEDIPESPRKVNGELQIYKAHEECDTESEPDDPLFDKPRESVKILSEKDSESSKTSSEHDVLEDDLKSDEKLNSKGSDSEEKWDEKGIESDTNLYKDDEESEEKLYISDSELEKESLNKERKSEDLLPEENAEDEVSNYEEPKSVENSCNEDELTDEDTLGKESDSNEALLDNNSDDEKAYEKSESNEKLCVGKACDKELESDDRVNEIDSDSYKVVQSRDNESNGDPKNEELEVDKRVCHEITEFDVSDEDADFAERLIDIDNEKTASAGINNDNKTGLKDIDNEKALLTDIEAEKTSSPDTDVEKTTSPDIDAEKTASPDIAAEKTASPDIAAEKTASPDIDAEKTASPDIDAEKTASPDIDAEKTASPDIDAEKTASPDIDAEKTVSTDIDAEKTASTDIDTEKTVLADIDTEKTVLTIADGIKTRARNNRETRFASSTNLQVTTSRKRKRKASPICKDLSQKDSKPASVDCNVEFKGFKKRMLAQASPPSNTPLTSVSGNSFHTSRELERIATPPSSLSYGADSSTRLTEYAQYLGLQPTVKFKCFKCGESGFPSMSALHEHQIVCLKTVKSQSIPKYVVATAQPPTSTATTLSSGTPSTNFRITRKVYLCSACGTYYENWNLFEHMRVVHKRLICLFCLGMFAQADKLSAHLCNIHRMTEKVFQSAEHFMNEFKGSSFLMCCSCEKLFEETNNFFDHHCEQLNVNELCKSCGVHGTCHLTDCKQKLANKSLQSSSAAPTDSAATSTPANTIIKEPQESSTPKKYLLPSKKKVTSSSKDCKHDSVLLDTGSRKNKPQEKEFSDEDYDISDAASFCHVNIHEQPENQNDDTRTKTYAKKVSPEGEMNGGKPTTLTNDTTTQTDSDTESIKSFKDVSDEELPKPDEGKTVSSTYKEVASSNSSRSCEFSELKKDARKVQKSTDPISDVKSSDSQEPHIADANSPENDSESSTDKSKEQNDVESESFNQISETENLLYSLKVESIYEPPHSSETGATASCTQKPDKNECTDNIDNQTEKLAMVENNSIDNQTEHLTVDPGFDHKNDVLSKDELPSDENSTTLPEVSQSSHLVESGSNQVEDTAIKSPISIDGLDAETPACTSDTQIKDNSSGSDNDTTHGSIAQSSSTDVSSDESQHQDDFQKQENKTQSHIDSEDENVDSDKMSLVVDENGSDDDIDSREENENKTDKITSEVKLFGTEITKQDTESDVESKQDSVADAQDVVEKEETKMEESQDIMHVAETDAPLLELTLDRNIDEMSCPELIKECVKVSSASCVYCNHAKKIAVNGKQLLLHVLAEHRFSIVVCSDSGELTEVNGFVSKLEKNAEELQDVYFNAETYDSSIKILARSFDKTYECFHCHFLTMSHKELYLHNRKMHQKTILLCIMCKSNFYSYSELLCHICPGIYVSDSNINFRCCLCDVDGLPSAFRLLVHLRKRHNACDVCLETTGDQQKLSNHVWKHKLHHLCYRCGIAYRNKPDITKHLFWKHGTESVLCKRCLQKKWPHVYHFCIPPTTFVCEECSAHFSRAVALKVHKRLHAGDLPYSCEECDERFISKKLLAKHRRKHECVSEKENILENTSSNVDDHQKTMAFDEAAPQQDKCVKETSSDNELEMECVQKNTVPNIANENNENGESELKGSESEQKERVDKKSKVVDVYDLPPLNLSSDSDDSDVEDVNKCKPVNLINENQESDSESKANNEICLDENQLPAQVLDGIWDNFKTYKANLDKREGLAVSDGETLYSLDDVLRAVILDHDYCGSVLETDIKPDVPGGVNAVAENAEQSLPTSAEVKDSTDEKTGDEKNRFDAEHNYCFSNDTSPNENEVKESPVAPEESPVIQSKKKQKTVKKKQKRSASSSSSDSSSSDSSSCSCGTNCSCSSSSSSSSGSSSSQSSDSDSSSSEGRRRQAARRERRKERAKNKKKVEDTSKSEIKLEESATPVCGSSCEVEDPAAKHNAVLEHDENEPTIKESDLETDETETDEDFYDKHPQKLANKLLAEKRNQLLLLAAVAPVNNGTIAATSPAADVSPEIHATGKKIKTKKRRKPQYQQQPPAKKIKVDNLPKPNTSTSFYNNQVSTFTVSSSLPSASNQTAQVTIPTTAPLPQIPYSPNIPHPTPAPSYHSTGSGSETDSKRLSRRRRVPKRFYGDTSDEEGDSTPQRKWQKTSVNESPLPSSSTFSYRSGVNSLSEPKRTVAVPLQEKSDDEDVGDDSESEREMKRSNSDSSNSDSEKGNEQSDLDSDTDNHSVTHAQTTVKSGEDGQQKSDNLYCYCQCPYDEVSEMIACDGKGCAIEWFHFECVGIMVPPKGEWFCPDCRKKLTSRTEQVLHA